MNDEPPTAVEKRSAVRALGGATGVRYQLGELIGKGGMGEVLAAHDELIGRDVAIKRLRGEATDLVLERFMREATIQGRLEHPAIVPVHEVGVDDDGIPFLVMKKLAGTTLAAIVEAPDPEKHSRQRLLRAFVEICFAVEFAHSRGVIHRDLKPANIVLGEFGEVYVIDWGIAKHVGLPDLPPVGHSGSTESADGESGTRDGFVVGTPGYMAPEQRRAVRDLDARVDVYALGCVLYELLTGSRFEPRGNVLAASAVPPAIRDLPPELYAICLDATRTDRTERIQTARELSRRVEKFLDGDRDLARRQQLSRELLEQAKVSTDRRVAMGEAGRALALDPTNAEAAAFVGRMMLEPPAETPPEVLEAMRSHDKVVTKRGLKTSAWASVGFAWILPALFSMLVSHPAYAVALVVLPIVGSFVAHRFAVDSAARMVALVASWSAYSALLAHTYSPVLFAPTFAAICALSLASSPPQRGGWSAVWIGAGFTGAIVLTWVAELVGLIEPTVIASRGSITLVARGLDIHPAITIATLVMWVLVAVPACAAIGFTRRRHEIGLRHRLEMQAWQLRQLFPVA